MATKIGILIVQIECVLQYPLFFANINTKRQQYVYSQSFEMVKWKDQANGLLETVKNLEGQGALYL